nr:reverse transcriptase domain-containing protein [Tanacetum cinerariifolium]
MLVEVGKFTFPVDFVILEIKEDSKVPLILRRPFLHTSDAVISVKQKQLNLGVRTERMIFNINSAMKHSYSNDDTCFNIDVIDEILEEDFDALLNEGFYWPTINKEAHTLVRLCEACQKTSNISKHDEMPLNNIQAKAQALPTNDARVVVTLLKKTILPFQNAQSSNQRHSGQVKNTNKALKRILEKSVKENPAIWSRKLNDALWALHTAYKTPTGTTPYKLIYGKNFHLPFEIEHRAYWAIKNCNPDLIAAGEKRMF